MRGYDSTTYGDGFADVYDEWYESVTDVHATVATTKRLAGPGGTVLELGVGTGRLAIPLAQAGLRVVGIDSSQAMLDQLHQRRSDDLDLDIVCGDMVSDLPDGPFDACLVAYNTIFNLLDSDDQYRCFAEVASRLASGGVFIVEAIVPDADAEAGTDVTVRSMSADRVVLSVSDHQPGTQRTSGQFIELTEAGGVRLRPWAIRWTLPSELDQMAEAAGLQLVERFGDMAGAEFDELSNQHVSVYRVA